MSLPEQSSCVSTAYEIPTSKIYLEHVWRSRKAVIQSVVVCHAEHTKRRRSASTKCSSGTIASCMASHHVPLSVGCLYVNLGGCKVPPMICSTVCLDHQAEGMSNTQGRRVRDGSECVRGNGSGKVGGLREI